MTKMNMVWIAVATLIYPETRPDRRVSKEQIDARVRKLFRTTITPVMITHHLVASEDRQRDHRYPRRGGSRNRYLTKQDDRYRLYRLSDQPDDGLDKTGPYCPSIDAVTEEFRYLVYWYCRTYVDP
ncbi:MAG: hypothetical protein F4X99_06100 [Gammaproteobacteria bacterium]|nr:hypothetical protein [Gammaproteobacteria bacterium]